MKKNSVLTMLVLSLLCTTGCIKDTSSSSSSTSNPTSNSSNSSSLKDSSSTTSSSTSSSSSSSSSSSPIDETPNIEEAVKSAVENADKIKSGVVHYKEKTSYNESEHDKTYEFGDGFFHYSEPDWSGNPQDYYYFLDESNNIVPVLSSNNGLSKPYGTFTKFGIPLKPFGYSPSYVGVEDLLNSTFTTAKANENNDYLSSYDNGIYSYSYGYLLDTSSYFKVNVNFALGTNKELKTFNISCLKYANNNFVKDLELGTVQLNPDATPSNTLSYNIEQVTGSRDAKAPFTLNDLYATSFELSYNDTLISSQVLEVEVSNSLEFKFSNLTPATTSFVFDTLTFTVVSGDESGISSRYDTYYNQISISANKAGDYVLEIKSRNVTKTINIHVNNAKPKSISVTYFEPDGLYYMGDVLTNSVNAYINEPLYFAPSINPSAASQEVVITTTAPEGTYSVEKTSLQINEWYAKDGIISTLFTEPGSYTLTFAAEANTEIYTSTTVNVIERPQMYEVLVGDYAVKRNGVLTYFVTFTPNDNGMSGSAVITNKASNLTEHVTYTVVKNEETNEYDITFTHVEGTEFNLNATMNTSYKISLSEGANNYNLSKVTHEFMAAGTWTASTETNQFILQLNENNVAMLIINDIKGTYIGYTELHFEIKETENSLEIVFSASAYTGTQSYISYDEAAILTTDYSSITMNIYMNGVAIPCTFTIDSGY